MQHMWTGLQVDHLQTAVRTQLLINTELTETIDVHHTVDLTPTVTQLNQRPYA
ncbi:hypothetical protein D3C87_2044720 [compost metagenome]